MGCTYWTERISICGPPSTGRYQCFDWYRGIPTNTEMYQPVLPQISTVTKGYRSIRP
ncbi:hypothetical protein GW17_00038663, partial [Ensete ventricosum]